MLLMLPSVDKADITVAENFQTIDMLSSGSQLQLRGQKKDSVFHIVLETNSDKIPKRER